jgi:uncharacterized protein with von Willebrand factor type A (vWA) domain
VPDGGPAADSSLSSVEIAVAFARVLRSRGLTIPVGTVVTFAEALDAVGLAGRDGVYWAGRTTLVRKPEDIGVYDKVFDAFWLGRRPDGAADPVATETVTLVLDDPDGEEGADQGDDEEEIEGPVLAVRYSGPEILRHRDFAAYSDDEFAEARRLMADLRLAGALRQSRRLQPARRGRGSRPDLRRTVRRAIRSGGEAVRQERLEASQRPRRVILLCDVSGSMEPYSRALVRFLHAAVTSRQRGRVEAFALGTRLTRITRELSSRDPDAAIAAAARQVVDWSGGTRLGEGLRQFNDRWGVRGMARGAVVVILSDGWDRGDPEQLGREMARLSRVAFRIVWVNPLKAAPGYAPLARGMAAALPYVDNFVAGHSLASLEELARVVSAGGRSERRPAPVSAAGPGDG